MSGGRAGHPAGARGAPWTGWALLAALALYAALVHHGAGPAPRSGEPAWSAPRGFFSDWGFLDPVLASSPLTIAVLGAPALLLAAFVFRTARSALACALAGACAVATLLFLYYGFVFPFAWEFFGWRGSAVMGLVGLCVGATLAAPRLAAAWLRAGWPLRLAVYLPLAFGVLAFVGNATGTDPSLRFALSPWPAVPVFGLEVGAAVLAAWFAGLAAGAALAAAARGRAGAGRAGLELAALLAGALVPAALIAAAASLGLFPFRVRGGVLAAMAVAGALGTALAAGWRRAPPVLRVRARHLALGAALVAAPLAVALAIERRDYVETRDVRAQRIIDGLEAYYAQEQIYPDELDALVEREILPEIPEPEIGFGFLYDGDFSYQSFGTGYVLEFPAPRWVQCAYNPPWEDYEDDVGEDDEDESLGGAWSCPSEPPELW